VLIPVFTTRFAEKRGKDLVKIKAVIALPAEQVPLPADYRDLHIEPDWLLLYRVDGEELRLARTGRHTDVFNEWPHDSTAAT
jgi:mRNA interferase YafQ